MLIYSDVYCNDESSHWTLKWDKRQRLAEEQLTSWRNWQLRKLFTVKRQPSPSEIKKLLNKWQISPQSMLQWSRLGNSS